NKGILSGCTKMTVSIIDNKKINLSNPAGDTLYLIRDSRGGVILMLDILSKLLVLKPQFC
ncbi:MAG: hypothetical protein WAK17_01630, partial [Candidatus Nitrosopolaris sp.]